MTDTPELKAGDRFHLPVEAMGIVGVECAPALERDLSYINHLQRCNADALSFYPTIVFEREIGNRRLILARLNGEPAGYLYHGSFGVLCPIHQACIEYDIRGHLYGAALVRFFEARCHAAGVLSVTLRCGSDIQANGFWRAMGYECEAVRKGGARRMRDINCWRKPLQPQLFDIRAIVPSDRPQDATLWRRHKSAQSRFVRGTALLAYREAVEAAGKASLP